MTLKTHIILDQYVDIYELRDWINLNLLNAPDALFDGSEKPGCSASNMLGQGFNAWLMISAKNGELMAVGREDWMDDGDWERASREPEGFVNVAFDTSYGYKGPGGEDCAELHATYIMRLQREFLDPRGIGLWWQNEFRGEWYQGVQKQDILTFIGGGEEANSWFTNVVLPAIPALIAEGR